MPDQVQLKYQTSKTVTLDILAVRGAAEPDSVSLFPAVLHEMLDGSLAQQIAGGRRNVEVSFQVMSGADRRKVVDWWLDPDRQIVCLASAPTITANTPIVGGSLTQGVVYYYKVCTIDMVGHSTASNESSQEAGPGGSETNRTIPVTWPTVANARSYKIYRKAGVGGTYKLLDYTPTNSYTDNGSVTPLRDENPPASASTINVVTEESLEFMWGHGTELARLLTLRLRERTIFLSTDGFPI